MSHGRFELFRALAIAETLSLLMNWAALMALSLVLAFAADVGGAARPGVIWFVVIAAAAALKSRIVLRSYLGLARAPGALAGFFSAALIVLALVAASFALFPTPHNPKIPSSTAGAIE